MNWNEMEAKWKELNGGVGKPRGKIIDDELTVVTGKRDNLAGIIRTKSSLAKEAADDEIAKFERTRTLR